MMYRNSRFSSAYARMYLVPPTIYEKLLSCIDEKLKRQVMDVNRDTNIPSAEERPSSTYIDNLNQDEFGVQTNVEVPQLQEPYNMPVLDDGDVPMYTGTEEQRNIIEDFNRNIDIPEFDPQPMDPQPRDPLNPLTQPCPPTVASYTIPTSVQNNELVPNNINLPLHPEIVRIKQYVANLARTNPEMFVKSKTPVVPQPGTVAPIVTVPQENLRVNLTRLPKKPKFVSTSKYVANLARTNPEMFWQPPVPPVEVQLPTPQLTPRSLIPMLNRLPANISNVNTIYPVEDLPLSAFKRKKIIPKKTVPFQYRDPKLMQNVKIPLKRLNVPGVSWMDNLKYVKGLKCPICNKDFSRNSSVKRHMHATHRNMIPSQTVSTTATDVNEPQPSTSAAPVEFEQWQGKRKRPQIEPPELPNIIRKKPPRRDKKIKRNPNVEDDEFSNWG